MTAVSDWAVGLCSAAVGLSLVMLLVPSGRSRKTVITLAGVCYFCALISPVASWCRRGGFAVDIAAFGTEVSEEMIQLTDEQIDRVIEEALCLDAGARLEAYDVTVTKARLIRDSSEQDGIYIRQVELTMQGALLPREVYRELELAWGVEVEVIRIDG